MMRLLRHFSVFCLSYLFVSPFIHAQEKGIISGDLMLNSDYYINDDRIGTNTTQYERELNSAESWLYLNYRVKGYSFSVRYDLFNNSPLLDPEEAYTEQGLAFFSIKKEIGDLEVTVGSFYDQFGSGIIFRAYEDRTIGLDYAIEGVRVKYDFSETMRVKAFTGKQKFRFTTQDAVLQGANFEKDFLISDKLQVFSGFAALNRTMTTSTTNLIADEINSYPLEERFVPRQNVYSFSGYSDIRFGRFSLYTEYAYKTSEAINNEAGNRFIESDGDLLYTSLNYSQKGFGLNVQYKLSNQYVIRTSPFTTFLEGIVSFLPPITKQHSLRLPARYSPAVQEFGEDGFQIDMTYSPDRRSTFSANYSLINNAFGERIFREAYFDYYRVHNRKLKTTVGFQTLIYDQDIFEGKPGVPLVYSYTPFAEIAYKITRKKSLRMELQYLRTDQDQGDLAFILLEYNVAPKFSISVSDMINTRPQLLDEDIIHYYTIFGVYTLKQTRFSLGYVKQIEGVVCTGGVCRVEPAFSGVRFGLTTNF